MSVLIKGMEMPKDGCHHTITIYSDGTVATGKANNYKAIEVPTPHGRLIDADKITMHKQLEACGNGKYKSILVAYENNIDITPTVIESEE